MARAYTVVITQILCKSGGAIRTMLYDCTKQLIKLFNYALCAVCVCANVSNSLLFIFFLFPPSSVKIDCHSRSQCIRLSRCSWNLGTGYVQNATQRMSQAKMHVHVCVKDVRISIPIPM